MVSKIKYLVLICFLCLTAVSNAQVFTVAELNSLVKLDADEFKKSVVEKGYITENIVTGDGAMTQDYVYSHPQEAVISLICPTFGTDTKMLSWEFKSETIYDAIKADLLKNGYKLEHTEKRNNGKYIELSYGKPGSDIFLSSDKRTSPQGIYILSERYTSLPGLVKKK